MRTYEEFKQALVNSIQERFSEIESVTIHTAVKNNVEEEQITIRFPGDSVVPSISLQELFTEYAEKENLDQIAARLGEYQKYIPDGIALPVLTIQEAREKLFFQMISRENNEKLLSEVPYTEMKGTDLVLILRWKCGENASFIVKHGISDQLGITDAELIQMAEDNLALESWRLRTMVEVMMDMMGDVDLDIPEPDLPMYVLTNKDASMGARILHVPGILSSIRSEMGSDYYILPSSTHELLIIPDMGEVTARELATMVRDVNETQVEPKDRLSDHVYHFSEQRGLTIAG